MDTELLIPESEALLAVRNRDAAYDGKLFFAVVTTGIFCKPSCSSRAAKPENMRFYSSAAMARTQGFRACKRCAPEKSAQESNPVFEIARYIEANVDHKLTLASLAEQFDLSPAYLQKVFKATMGLSPKGFQDGIRQNKFKSLLKDGHSVTEAVFAAGYGSSSRAYEKSGDQFGMTPGEFKDGAADQHITYTLGKTQVGLLMLAATDVGVCFCMFGETGAQLLQQLHQEFPQAITEQAGTATELDEWFNQIDQYLSASAALPKLPLDLRGTAFQLRVWEFLKSIADGKVVTYKDVANGIDQPAAFRAAATACGKNRIAVLIPCHRVLRGDGGMGGYRWGVETKRQLLELERQRHS